MNLKFEKLLLAALAIVMVTACSSPEPKAEEEQTEEIVEEVISDEIEWIIVEDGFGVDGPQKVTLTAPKEEQPEDAAMIETEPITHDELAERIEPLDFMEPAMIEIEVTEMIIPIYETETLTAYNSKGKEKGSIQVIHDLQTGEVVSVSYTHKDHVDEYDVSPGMSAKDVKKVRKDMKHMMHRGEYFLYSDVSNIMYVLDVKDNMGDEYTEMELDQFEVDAIVWKDKKHHKDLEEINFIEE